MPGTASSKLQSRAHAKARPSATARATSLVANTPVLFRLPIVPTVPTQELAATFAESAVQLPTATLAAVAGTTATVAAPAIAMPTEAAKPAAHEPPTRTWWEHWSSGIVLIVLLIALATASIMAWQGGDKGKDKLLADTNTPTESLTDLSAIEVPKIEIPKLQVPKMEGPSTTTDSATANSKSANQKSDESLDDSLIPSEPSSLSFDPPAAKADSHATASLQSPIVKQQEPLFNDEPSTATATISAQPASSSTQLNASPSKSNAAGDSPAIWDSSSNKQTSTGDSKLGSSLDSGLELSSNSNSTVDKSTSPTSSSTPTTPALLTSSSTTPPATNLPAAAPGATVPSNMQYAAKTTTPELDRAALFATFRQYASADMTAAAETSTNRYKSTAGTTTGTPATQIASQPNTQSMQPTQPNQLVQPGTPTSMVGYTQQQPTAPKNYTLQSTPNYSPTATQPNSAQQNMTQPNMTQPQYPSQQLSAPQYQTQQPQQYQQQQYQAPQQPAQQYQTQQNQPQQYQAQPQTQPYQTQPYSNGGQTAPAQQFTAPNNTPNSSLSTGNGYYIPPVAPTSTSGASPNTLSYPSLK